MRLGGILRFRLRTRDAPVTVWIEPWCEEVALAVGSQLELAIEYGERRRLETQLTNDVFVIDVWGGCRAKLFIDGVRMLPRSMRLRFPDIWFEQPPPTG